MAMKLAVVGTRTFSNFDLLDREIAKIIKVFKVDEIISGGAAGADSMGIMFARDHGLPSAVYFPDWTAGKVAGVIRNAKLAEEADMVVAFWDGKSHGTADMIERAKALDKVVIVVRYDQQALK
jgi:hypothetical protein